MCNVPLSFHTGVQSHDTSKDSFWSYVLEVSVTIYYPVNCFSSRKWPRNSSDLDETSYSGSEPRYTEWPHMWSFTVQVKVTISRKCLSLFHQLHQSSNLDERSYSKGQGRIQLMYFIIPFTSRGYRDAHMRVCVGT